MNKEFQVLKELRLPVTTINDLISSPCFLSLLGLKKVDIIEIANHILRLLKEKELSPIFPNTLYLIVPKEHCLYNLGIPTIDSVSQIPYFYCKEEFVASDNTRKILNSIEVTAKKIQTIDIENKLNLLESCSRSNRLIKLNYLTKKFLNSIQYKMGNKRVSRG